jgi:hypothetical protein
MSVEQGMIKQQIGGILKQGAGFRALFGQRPRRA